MVVSIDENVLLGVVLALFVPLFIFFVKLIVEIGAIKNRMESIVEEMKEYHLMIHEISGLHSDINLIKLRLENIERVIQQQQRQEHNSNKNTGSKSSPI